MAWLWRSEDLWESSGRAISDLNPHAPRHLFRPWALVLFAFYASTLTAEPCPQALSASSAQVSFNSLNSAVCLECLTLPFSNESGFQIFLQTPPSLENHLALNHSWFEYWSESPGNRGFLLPQNFGHHAVNWIPRRDRNCGRWERFLLSPNLQPWNSLPNWAGSLLILPLCKCVKYHRDAGDSWSSSTSSGVIFDVLEKCDIRT